MTITTPKCYVKSESENEMSQVQGYLLDAVRLRLM